MSTSMFPDVLEDITYALHSNEFVETLSDVQSLLDLLKLQHHDRWGACLLTADRFGFGCLTMGDSKYSPQLSIKRAVMVKPMMTR